MITKYTLFAPNPKDTCIILHLVKNDVIFSCITSHFYFIQTFDLIPNVYACLLCTFAYQEISSSNKHQDIKMCPMCQSQMCQRKMCQSPIKGVILLKISIADGL